MLKRVGAISLLALMAGIMPVQAQPAGEQPRWIRDPAIAPDGETLSFTYRGQVFLVDAEGGLAVPLTAAGSYSHGAVWAPDSERLALASEVNGNDDLYITDFSGSLQRYSWSQGSEVPTSFAPDGQSLLFTNLGIGDAERSVQGPLSYAPQLYSVDVATGRDRLVLPNLAAEARWNADQTKLVYTYDPSVDPSERQMRVAANARQIWVYDAVSGVHTRLFAIDGADRLNPVWSADGQSLYYLSEASGRLNVWQAKTDGSGETQLTHYTDDPVRDLSIADNGTIAFAHNGRIYVKAPGAAEPVAIEILTLDQHAGHALNYLADAITEFVSSPDGQRHALVANANVFLLDRSGLYRQITATPGEERNIAFSPDGSTLVYAAQREHEWGIYGVSLDTEEGDEPLALRYEETAFYVPESGNALQPAFSPDSSKLAFIADRREVKVLDLETGAVVTPFEPSDYNTSYFDGDLWFSWSPTSQDLLVQWGSIAVGEQVRLAIVPADGVGEPQPLPAAVNALYWGVWSLDGTQVLAGTDHFGLRSAKLERITSDLYRVFVSEEARQDFLDIAEGDISPDMLDEDGYLVPQRYDAGGFRSQRLEGRLGDGFSTQPLMVPFDQQNMLAVRAGGDDQYGIFLLNLQTGEPTLIQEVTVPGLISASYVPALGVVDLASAESIVSIPLAEPETISATPLRLFYSANREASRAAAFEQAWADIKYRYYDANLEGRDWDAIGAKYRAYLGSIASDRELADLIRAMYGELSASHMFIRDDGSRAPVDGIGTQSASLGVYIDYGYSGEGRRVAAVVPGGPLDRTGLGIDPGDIITSINGAAVPEAGGLERLLDLNFGKQVLLGIVDHDSDGKEERLVYVKPIHWFAELKLARERLLDARRELTERLSNACVAYQYVPGMNNPAYLDVLGRLSSARQIAKAAIIDVRSNTGGNLTRELVTLLTGQPYSTMGVDGRPGEIEPNNRWVWPSAVLVDSFGYSDGSVFPQAYHDLSIGTIVGDTVLNTGTAVNYVQSKVVPNLNYGIPVLPSRRLDGTYYENAVVNPDILVPFDPNKAGIGVDPQLEAAVAALMQQIGPDADCR